MFRSIRITLKILLWLSIPIGIVSFFAGNPKVPGPAIFMGLMTMIGVWVFLLTLLGVFVAWVIKGILR